MCVSERAVAWVVAQKTQTDGYKVLKYGFSELSPRDEYYLVSDSARQGRDGLVYLKGESLKGLNLEYPSNTKLPRPQNQVKDVSESMLKMQSEEISQLKAELESLKRELFEETARADYYEAEERKLRLENAALKAHVSNLEARIKIVLTTLS